jgi:hypothetical protein
MTLKRFQFSPGDLVLVLTHSDDATHPAIVLSRRDDPTGVYPIYRVLEADGEESVLMEYEMEHSHMELD